VLTVWARVLRRTVRSPSGCWLWQGAHNGKGYGTIGRPGQTNILVHRVALLVHKPDQLAPGLQADHMCHDRNCWEPTPCSHRRCVNPAHLRLVTAKENNARRLEGNTCRLGHLYSVRRNGARFCPTCQELARLGLRYTRAQLASWDTLPLELADLAASSPSGHLTSVSG